jgi:leader peptidase (prepilin peptidase)/N-methyltransferase
MRSLRVMHEGNKAITGQEGMGHGDFKLLSAIGAWLQDGKALLPVLIVASLSGL